MSRGFTGEVVSVSQLIDRACAALDQSVGTIAVEGEVFEYRGPHSSGHYYFKLRDGDASIDVKMWRGVAQRGMKTQLQEGRAVLGLGRLDIWAKRGSLSFLLDEVRDLGAGNLAQRFEDLKRRLREEGLFEEARKRPIPSLPRCVALVTAIPSAAAADIEQTWREFTPAFEVQRFATRVQGDGAEHEIVAALRAAAASGADVILLARGGGSLEDLWAFNEEATVRAIIASPAPVVCAVGHESDVTLADFAADLREKTPTAGAMRLADGWSKSRGQVRELARRLDLAMLAQLGDQRLAVGGAGKDLQRAADAVTESARNTLERARLSLRAQRPDRRLARARQALHENEIRLEYQSKRLLGAAKHRLRASGTALHTAAFRPRLAALAARLESAGRQLHAASPQSLLDRGYALVRPLAGGPFVRDAAEVSVGDRVEIRVAEGRFEAEVAASADSEN